MIHNARLEKEKMIKRYIEQFGRTVTRCQPPEDEKHDCDICFSEAGVVGLNTRCAHYFCQTCATKSIGNIMDQGQFPAVCPGCKAERSVLGHFERSVLGIGKDMQVDAISTGILAFLVQRRVIDRAQALRFKALQDRAIHEAQTEALINTSSKGCPSCGTLVSHYKYHACHHIRPGSGCPGCGTHFCYCCLARWEGSCPNGCKLFCYKDCGCPICPDCKPGEKCDDCDLCPACKLPTEKLLKYYSDEESED